MKTKRRNYWSFFWRVGAGFLAFWLAVMAGFTLLLGWQTAQEMRTVMMENLKYFNRKKKIQLVYGTCEGNLSIAKTFITFKTSRNCQLHSLCLLKIYFKLNL